MKSVNYEEDGVATAVGAIFAILIFIFLLSLFVTSYVPAEMTSYEEQYTSGLNNDMMQFISAVSLLSLNYQQGETTSVTFELQSGYVPLFASPTVGELALTQSSKASAGYVLVNNSTMQISSGGTLSVYTNNRYFVNEAFSFELSSLFYEQYGSNPFVNTSLESNVLQVGPPSNGSTNLQLNLVNLMGGPLTISSQSPISLSLTAASENSYLLGGNFTLTYFSIFGYQFYNSILEKLSTIKGIDIKQINEGNGHEQIQFSSATLPFTLSVHELNVVVIVSS